MNVTEMISSLVTARKMGATAHDLMTSIHPHPTMSEGIMEAAAAAGRGIHALGEASSRMSPVGKCKYYH
jgi:dihydrolipoamide dehydrogenase